MTLKQDERKKSNCRGTINYLVLFQLLIGLTMLSLPGGGTGIIVN